MARRRSKRWKRLKPMGKRMTMPREELEAIRKKRRKPDGIYYDTCKVKK